MAIIASGEVLLEGSPNDALQAIDGQIWSRVVATDDELRALESELHIVSTHLVGGQHEIRVFSPASPGAGFRAAPSGLEDVYFLEFVAPRQALSSPKEPPWECSWSFSSSRCAFA